MNKAIKILLNSSALKCADLIKDLCKKINGEDGQEWQSALEHFLQRENPWVRPIVDGRLDELISRGRYRTNNEVCFICDANAPMYYNTPEDAQVEYLELGDMVSCEQCLEKMEALGYRVAEDLEVLVHDIQHPEQIYGRSAVAILNPGWGYRGSPHVMVVGSPGDEFGSTPHYICLEPWGRLWNIDGPEHRYKFAAVKKQ